MKKLMMVVVVAMMAGCVARAPRVLEQAKGCPAWSSVHLPITVGLAEGAEGHRDSVNRAMKDWNDAMGRTAFVWMYVDAKPDLVIGTGVPAHDHEESIARICRDGKMTQEVVMAGHFDDGAFYRFTQHALGHALGLDHSTAEVSVMSSDLDVDLMGENDWDSGELDGPHFYFITPNDAELANRLHPKQAESPVVGSR